MRKRGIDREGHLGFRSNAMPSLGISRSPTTGGRAAKQCERGIEFLVLIRLHFGVFVCCSCHRIIRQSQVCAISSGAASSVKWLVFSESRECESVRKLP